MPGPDGVGIVAGADLTMITGVLEGCVAGIVLVVTTRLSDGEVCDTFDWEKATTEAARINRTERTLLFIGGDGST